MGEGVGAVTVPAFHSQLSDVVVSTHGWFRLPSGVWITKLPLLDAREHLFARLGAGPAAEWARAHGYRLPTVAEYEALHTAAYHIEPYALPTVEMLAAAGADTQAEAQALRVANMMGRPWCELHDLEVWKRLAGWNGLLPVDNAGKHWTREGGIYGWWTPFARKYGADNDYMIQGHSFFHKSQPRYGDYGTTTVVVSETDPRNARAHGARAEEQTMKRGDRGEQVKVWQALIGATADGAFGPKTEAATKTWQTAHGLAADGVVTPAMVKLAQCEATKEPAPSTEQVTIANFPGSDRLPTEFWARLAGLCIELGNAPDGAACIMYHESGFRPEAINPSDGGSGLIQFTGSRIKATLGWSVEEIRRMSAMEQLEGPCAKFWGKARGKLQTAGDYGAWNMGQDPSAPNSKILAPAHRPWGGQPALHKRLDHDGDGHVSLGDVKTEAEKTMARAAGRPRIVVTPTFG